ncbi:MAG: hypothetical protein MI923_09455 [Phycisphaerales bacterium]|nr:hypothetical protein [Phycisphaerales bacterium]
MAWPISDRISIEQPPKKGVRRQGFGETRRALPLSYGPVQKMDPAGFEPATSGVMIHVVPPAFAVLSPRHSLHNSPGLNLVKELREHP